MNGGLKGLLARFRIDPYLLLLVGMIVLASLVPARDAAAGAITWFTRIAVALVFFLHGARLSREAVIRGLTHWRLHVLVLAATFILFPILCLGVTFLPAWITPPVLSPGIILLGCLPATLQSAVAFTAIARGNVAAAVASASASNVLGVFLTPVMASILLHAQGSVSTGAFLAILLQLLAPFILGQLLRPWIGEWVARHGKRLSKLDRGAILLVVYAAFSGAVVQGVWSQLSALDLLKLLMLCAVVLAGVLSATWLAGRVFGFDIVDRITIIFCGSKKSLASGAPMAAAIFPAHLAGVALLPLMVFHQLQLMACSMIAQHYAKRRDDAGKSV